MQIPPFRFLNRFTVTSRHRNMVQMYFELVNQAETHIIQTPLKLSRLQQALAGHGARN